MQPKLAHSLTDTIHRSNPNMSLSSFLAQQRSMPACSIEFACSCNDQHAISSFAPLASLQFCPSCARLCCQHCSTCAIDTHYCSYCLNSVFSAHAAAANHRCDQCISCPRCESEQASLHPLASNRCNSAIPPCAVLQTHVDQKTQQFYWACTQCEYDTRAIGLVASDANALLARLNAHEAQITGNAQVNTSSSAAMASTSLNAESNNSSTSNPRIAAMEQCIRHYNSKIQQHQAALSAVESYQPYTRHAMKQFAQQQQLLDPSASHTVDEFLVKQHAIDEQKRSLIYRPWLQQHEDKAEDATSIGDLADKLDKSTLSDDEFDPIPQHLITGEFASAADGGDAHAMTSINSTLTLHQRQHFALPDQATMPHNATQSQLMPHRHRLSSLLAWRCKQCNRYTVKPSPAVTKAAFEINHSAMLQLPNLSIDATTISDQQLASLCAGHTVDLVVILRNPLERSVDVTISAVQRESTVPKSSAAAVSQQQINLLLTGDASVRQRRPEPLFDFDFSEPRPEATVQLASSEPVHVTLPPHDELADQAMHQPAPAQPLPTKGSCSSNADSVVWRSGCCVAIRLPMRLSAARQSSDAAAASASATSESAAAASAPSSSSGSPSPDASGGSSASPEISSQLWCDLALTLLLKKEEASADQQLEESTLNASASAPHVAASAAATPVPGASSTPSCASVVCRLILR